MYLREVMTAEYRDRLTREWNQRQAAIAYKRYALWLKKEVMCLEHSFETEIDKATRLIEREKN